MKAAAKLLGRDCGYSKSPMTEVGDALVERMAAILRTVRDENEHTPGLREEMR
jgi:4-hydroxy-tetrahydrodipicolinate synthase